MTEAVGLEGLNSPKSKSQISNAQFSEDVSYADLFNQQPHKEELFKKPNQKHSQEEGEL